MKIIFFKASGGTTHMLTRLGYALKFCIENNFELVIDTINHEAHRYNFSKYYSFNNFKILDINEAKEKYNGKIPKIYFTEQVRYNREKKRYFFNNKKVALEPSKEKMYQVVCNKGDLPFLLKRLKLSNKLLDFCNKFMIKEKYIGIHFRNTDMKTDIKLILNKMIKELEINKDIKIVYLATDDYKSIDLFKEKCPVKLICLTNLPKEEILTLHYCSDTVLNKYNLSKEQLIFELWRDIFLLKNSSIFIPSDKSSLSRFIIELRENNYIF